MTRPYHTVSAPVLAASTALLLSIATGGSAQTGSPTYELDVRIHPEGNRVEVEGVVRAPAGLAEDGRLVFLLSPDVDGLSIGGDEVTAVDSPAPDGVAQHVVTLSADVGDTAVVEISYDLVVPPDHRLNRITPEWIELNLDSFWTPIVSSIPNIRYRVRVDLGGAYTLISGDRTRELGPGVYTIENEIPRRDIPFSAGRDLRVARGEYAEAWSPLEDVDLETVVAKSDSILAFLEEYTGRSEDFHQPRRVVLTPREESGYSRKNYVAMSDVRDMSPTYLTDYLAHEFAHYWFSNANFQTRHHWLTESFAEYVSMIYMRGVYGDEWLEEDLASKRQRAEEDPTKLADFTTRPSFVAMYHRGPLVLHAFEEEVGPEAFRTLIRAFIREDVRTNEELFDLVEEELDSEASALLRELLARI